MNAIDTKMNHIYSMFWKNSTDLHKSDFMLFALFISMFHTMKAVMGFLLRVVNYPVDGRMLCKIADLENNKNKPAKIDQITILFADVEGSTRLYEKIGDSDAYEIIRGHFSRFESGIRRYGGEIIKTLGDGMMAAFNSPEAALQSALFITSQGCLKSGFNETGVKVGIHTGPALAVKSHHHFDYYGQTVNIAYRIQGLARTNEICFTRSAYSPQMISRLSGNQHVASSTEILKGVSNAEEIYRISA